MDLKVTVTLNESKSSHGEFYADFNIKTNYLGQNGTLSFEIDIKKKKKKDVLAIHESGGGIWMQFSRCSSALF